MIYLKCAQLYYNKFKSCMQNKAGKMMHKAGSYVSCRTNLHLSLHFPGNMFRKNKYG